MEPLLNQPVHMLYPELADIPNYPLPPGYGIRPYRTGDEGHWTAIQRSAETFFTVADTLFRREFGYDEEILAQRMVFVEDSTGTPIATITAWWQENWREMGSWGQIHWVAVHPAHQRLGISKAMLSWALLQLASWHGRAFLDTSTGRIWAIKVYLDFGFRPDLRELRNPDVLAAWRSVQVHLNHPVLAEILLDLP